MKMYTQYSTHSFRSFLMSVSSSSRAPRWWPVNNYNRALSTLSSCKGRRPFASWLAQANSNAGIG